MATNKPKSVLSFAPVMEGNKQVGFKPTADSVIYFASFGEEKAGKKYAVPVKARGDAATSTPQFDDAGNPVGELLQDADGSQLYLTDDGGLLDAESAQAVADDLSDEFIARTPVGLAKQDGVLLEIRQATPNVNLSKTVEEPTVVWPDGKMRSISIRMKANKPVLPADFVAQKSEQSEKRAAASVKGLSNDDLAKRAAALLAEAKARGVKVENGK